MREAYYTGGNDNWVKGTIFSMSMLKHWSKLSREALKSQPLEILLKFWLKKMWLSYTRPWAACSNFAVAPSGLCTRWHSEAPSSLNSTNGLVNGNCWITAWTSDWPPETSAESAAGAQVNAILPEWSEGVESGSTPPRPHLRADSQGGDPSSWSPSASPGYG